MEYFVESPDGVKGLLSRESAHDPAAADDEIVLIEHRRLARRDGALGRVQFHFRMSIA